MYFNEGPIEIKSRGCVVDFKFKKFIETLEFYDRHCVVAPGMRNVFYRGLCVLEGKPCSKHESLDISHDFKIPLMSKMAPKISEDDVKWEKRDTFVYLTRNTIKTFGNNVPSDDMETFWDQNKLSLYENEKALICRDQIKYRMPQWKYVKWS
eukprot:772749_1